jgi:ABC-2 type transport system permease protein
MGIVWLMALKEIRLLLRDRAVVVVLLFLPLLLTLIFGLLLGEGFGQKPDDRLRLSLVDEDIGTAPYTYAAIAGTVGSGANPLASLQPTIDLLAHQALMSRVPPPDLLATVAGGVGLSSNPSTRLQAALLLSSPSLREADSYRFPGEPWSHLVRKDLAETAGLKVEVIGSVGEAHRLVADHKRPAVLVFRPEFSFQVNRCSFLRDGINPFHREGVYLDRVGVDLISDEGQPVAVGIIDQVSQVTLMRVILPWMIGRAFERLSDPEFIQLLGTKVRLPIPPGAGLLFPGAVDNKVTLNEALRVAARNDKALQEYQAKVGAGVKVSLQEQFNKYNLTGKTWASLTRDEEAAVRNGSEDAYQNRDGSGLLRRGALRYQVLVPSFTVMFTFFLALIVGWVFVTERRQGTLRRLQAAPVTRGQILLGKLLPYFLLSLAQGAVLLVAGKLVFGMRWGPDEWPLDWQALVLLPVLLSTSLAAMGLAVLVAAVCRTEVQVALLGGIAVLGMALIGGCVLPREMMPEQAQFASLFTPHGWALQSYRELLGSTGRYVPNLDIVWRACAVLSGFGLGFLALAWGLLRLE